MCKLWNGTLRSLIASLKSPIDPKGLQIYIEVEVEVEEQKYIYIYIYIYVYVYKEREQKSIYL